MAGPVSRPAHQSSTVAVIDKLDILMRPEAHQAQGAGAGLLSSGFAHSSEHYRFDCDWDVTEQAGPPSEERCHNVAKTGVDSGGLPGTGGNDRMAGT